MLKPCILREGGRSPGVVGGVGAWCFRAVVFGENGRWCVVVAMEEERAALRGSRACVLLVVLLLGVFELAARRGSETTIPDN